MKRVLIFSLAYYPKHVGGAEMAIKEITDRIDPNEIEFHMVANRFDSTLPRVSREGNILVHRIGIATREPAMGDLKKFPLHLNKLFYQFEAAWVAYRLHRKYRYDGIWAMMAHATGVPSTLFKIVHSNVPYILELQEGDPIPHIERTMRPLWPFFIQAFRRADVVKAISTFLGKWARARGFRGPLEIIPNAVNTAHFSQAYSADELAEAKREIGKREGETWLVTTSRLVHKNAVDDVIRALALLPKSVKFLIFGTGPDEDALKKLARERGVADRAVFWGQIDHAVMPKYLKACDVFIRPSRSEGMGNSFVEAFAAELPVIATQEGGIADFLFDEKRDPDKPATGWAVDKNSPREIAEAVRDIMARPDQVRKVLKNAKELAFEKYDWDIIARDMKTRVFDKVVKAG
jgi:glycosyltransferase involved in cell wall biosynthesis